MKKNIKINWSKCKLLKSEVNYLGREISDKGITFSKEKMETMSSLPRPTTADELMLFLNSTNFMSSVIPNYAVLRHPLHSLMEDVMKEKGKRTKKAVQGVYSG